MVGTRAAVLAILLLAACSPARPVAPSPPAGTPGDAALGFLVNAANDAAAAAEKFIDPRLHGGTIGNWASGAGSQEDTIHVVGTSAVAGGGAALVKFSAVPCDRDRFGGRYCQQTAFESLIPTVNVGGHWYVSGVPFAADSTEKLSDYLLDGVVFTPDIAASNCGGAPISCSATLKYNRNVGYTSAAARQAFVFVDQSRRFACMPVDLSGGGTAVLTLTVTCPAGIASGDLLRVLYNDGADDYVYDAAARSRTAHAQAVSGEFSTTIAH